MLSRKVLASSLLAASLAIFPSCSKKEEKTDTPSSATSKNSQTNGSDQLSALLALAPKDSVTAVIMHPGTGTRLGEYFGNAKAILEKQPIIAKIFEKAMAEADAEKLKFFSKEGMAEAGIDPTRAAAIFVDANKDVHVVMPVNDSAKFRKFAEGEVEEIDGAKYDRFEDQICKESNGFYLCVEKVEHFANFSPEKTAHLAKQVKETPVQYKGDITATIDLKTLIEKFGNEADLPSLAQFADNFGVANIALKLPKGEFSLESRWQFTPKGPLAAATKVSDALYKELLAKGPTGLFRLAIPVAEILPLSKAPAEIPLPGGIDLRKDILENLSGELLLFSDPTQDFGFGLEVGIENRDKFAALVSTVCVLASTQAPKELSVQAGEGTCSVTADLTKLPITDGEMRRLFPGKIVGEISVADDRLRLKVQASGGELAKAVGSSPLTEAEHKNIGNRWNMAIMARQTSLIPLIENFPWALLESARDQQATDGIRAGMWVLGQLSGVFYAAGLREDGLHTQFRVSSYASDDDAAYDAYLGALGKSISGEHSPEAYENIAEKWPNSKVARHKSGSMGGASVFAGLVGMGAAVAIPAFVKYQNKSREITEQHEEKMKELNKRIEETAVIQTIKPGHAPEWLKEDSKQPQTDLEAEINRIKSSQ